LSSSSLCGCADTYHWGTGPTMTGTRDLFLPDSATTKCHRDFPPCLSPPIRISLRGNRSLPSRPAQIVLQLRAPCKHYRKRPSLLLPAAQAVVARFAQGAARRRRCSGRFNPSLESFNDGLGFLPSQLPSILRSFPLPEETVCHSQCRTLECAMIIVTGGSGKAGRACISELLAHDYEVASVDLVRPPDVPYHSAGLSSLISDRQWPKLWRAGPR